MGLTGFLGVGEDAALAYLPSFTFREKLYLVPEKPRDDEAGTDSPNLTSQGQDGAEFAFDALPDNGDFFIGFCGFSEGAADVAAEPLDTLSSNLADGLMDLRDGSFVFLRRRHG